MSDITLTYMANVLASNMPVLEEQAQELKELTAFLMLPISMFSIAHSGCVYYGYGVAASSPTMQGLFAYIRRKHYHVIEQALIALEGGGLNP